MLPAGTILICSSIESIASNLYQESFSRYIIHGYFAKMARRCFDVDISILATIIHILRAPLLSSNEFKTKWFNQLLEQPPLDPKGAKEPLGKYRRLWDICIRLTLWVPDDPEISLPSYYRHVAPKHELLILTTLALATDLLYANLSAASQAAGWAFEVSNGRFSKQQYWCVKGVVSDAVQGIETEVWMDLGEEMGEIEKEAGRLLSLRLCYGDDSLR